MATAEHTKIDVVYDGDDGDCEIDQKCVGIVVVVVVMVLSLKEKRNVESDLSAAAAAAAAVVAPHNQRTAAFLT